MGVGGFIDTFVSNMVILKYDRLMITFANCIQFAFFVYYIILVFYLSAGAKLVQITFKNCQKKKSLLKMLYLFVIDFKIIKILK
jgi:hypothetical protein